MTDRIDWCPAIQGTSRDGTPFRQNVECGGIIIPKNLKKVPNYKKNQIFHGSQNTNDLSRSWHLKYIKIQAF